MGDKRGRLEQGVGKVASVDAGTAGKLLATLAPILMGALGRQTRSQKLDPGSLAGYLRNERSQMESQTPKGAGAGFLGKLLDQDGDGDFDMSDALKLGMKWFMGGRRGR